MNIESVTQKVIDQDKGYIKVRFDAIYLFMFTLGCIIALRLFYFESFLFFEQVLSVGLAGVCLVLFIVIHFMNRGNKRFFAFLRFTFWLSFFANFFAIIPYGVLADGNREFYIGSLVISFFVFGTLFLKMNSACAMRKNATNEVLNLYYLVFAYMVQKYGLVESLKKHGINDPMIEAFITEGFSGEGPTSCTYSELYVRYQEDDCTKRVELSKLHPLSDSGYREGVENIQKVLSIIVRSFQRFNCILDKSGEDSRIVWNKNSIDEELNNLQFHNVSLLYQDIDFQTNESQSLMKSVDDIVNYSQK